MEKKSVMKKITGSREALLAVVLIVLFVIITAINPSFLTPKSLMDMLKNNAVTMVMSLGMLCVMLVGGIDISIMSTLALSGMSIGMLLKYEHISSTFLAFVIAIAIGIVCGAVVGLIMSWGLGRNVTLPTISKYAKSGINDEKTERDLAKKLLEEVDTKAVDIFQPASSLSGGNQQKVVVAKALSQEMKVVIMDEPTKGVDVGAKAEIYAIMGDLAKKGYAIILISSEMPEILGMADRIVVMCNGRKTGELNRGEATQERILELAMEKGHTGGAE